MPLKTDLNVNPYWDDYSVNKSYYRVLFKPSVAVQARELTQAQSMLQNHIEQFGNYSFNSGDIVSGCSIIDIPNLPFSRLADLSSNGSLDVSTLANTIAVSATTGLKARVIATMSGTTASYPNTNVIYFKYLNVGTNTTSNNVTSFSNNEQLNFYSIPANTLITSVNTYANATAGYTTTGNAHAVKVTDGIVYLNGVFVNIETPVIGLVNNFGTYAGNNLVGFVLNENIISYNQDPTLLDNALGYPNENAPGADRLQLTASLVSIDPTLLSNTSGFNAIANYNFGSLITKDLPSSSLFSSIGDAIAERIYEEAGNYVVNPFTVDTVATSPSTSLTANANQFYAKISPGVGYAQGYRVELLNSAYATVRKGTDTVTSQSQQITFNYGGYLICNEVSGLFPFNNVESVNLYSIPMKSVTTENYLSTAPSGTYLIGNANMRCFTPASGQPGTNTAQYYVHLFNIQMANGYTSSNIASIGYYNSGSLKGIADVVSNAGGVTSSPDQFFSFGVNALQSVSNSQYTYRRWSNANLTTSGNVTINITQSAIGGTDILTYGTGTLIDSEAITFSLVLLGSGNTANLTSTVTVTGTSNAVVGAATTFTNDFVVGDQITINGQTRMVASIANNTYLTVSNTFSAAAANGYYKTYSVGQYIPFSVSMPGNRGVNITSATSFTINTGQLPSSIIPCAVYYNVLRTQLTAAQKTINKSRFVCINTSNNPNGPWCLGFSDVQKITNVWGTANNSYSINGKNITNLFAFDNGQRDTYYGLSYLNLAPGASLSAYPYLLVQLDYFSPNYSQGVGFFDINSYPIDDINTSNTNAITTAQMPVYVDTSGQINPLRNYIDFRPVAVSTGTDTGFVNTSITAQVTAAIAVASAAANPSSTLTFNVPSGGVAPPAFGQNFQGTYTYYLPRKDLLYFSPSGAIKVKEGAPNINPQTPLYPDNGMPLAVINIPPYPSITPDLVANLAADNKLCVSQIRDVSAIVASSVITNRRYTMQDIGKLDTRISDLEYYASLSLLQTSATNLSITDQNGLNRFKNGIFVEQFSDFTTSAVSSPEYSISIDVGLQVAMPSIRRTTCDTPVNINHPSCNNVQKTGRCVTLPYTTVPHITQPCTTTKKTCTQRDDNCYKGTSTCMPEHDCHPDIVDTSSACKTGDDPDSIPTSQFSKSSYDCIYGTWRTASKVDRSNVNNCANNATTKSVVPNYNNTLPQPDPTRQSDHLCTKMTNNNKDVPTSNFCVGSQTSQWTSTPTINRGSCPASGAQQNPDGFHNKSSRH